MSSRNAADVEIITSAHVSNDARLNRHRTYLAAIGLQAAIKSYAGQRRLSAVMRATIATARSQAKAVVLPDPELHALGALVARLTGKRAVLDLHEDYRQVAYGRTWIPNGLEPVVGFAAAVVVSVGRLLANDVMVAAPQLAKPGETVVWNITPPGSVTAAPEVNPHKVVYVGDITVARGASEMADVARGLGHPFQLHLIGRADVEAERLLNEPSVAENVVLHGALPHSEAWKLAGDAVAGLSLLRPLPAYRDAVATKIWEYMAAGIPPVVSNLAGQATVVNEVDSRLVTTDTAEVVSLISDLSRDQNLRADVVIRAREAYNTAWEKFRPDLAVQSLFVP